MGTCCAPNFAIIFMAELAEAFLEQTLHKPRIWLRFIDEILRYKLQQIQLQMMLDELNQFHPQIKFT